MQMTTRTRPVSVLTCAIVAITLAAASGVASAQAANQAKAIKWAPSFKAAMAKAKSSNRLVMVDFYTEW